VAFEIHIHHHLPPGLRTDGTSAILAAIQELRTKMTDDLAGISGEIDTAIAAEGAAITLIQAFGAELAAAGTDPVKLGQLQTALAASDNALQAAIAAAQPPAAATPTVTPPVTPPVTTANAAAALAKTTS
jgi:hypothetical protein